MTPTTMVITHRSTLIIIREYTALDQVDQSEKVTESSAHDDDGHTDMAGISTSIGIPTKKFIWIVLVLVNVMCIILAARKTKGRFQGPAAGEVWVSLIQGVSRDQISMFYGTCERRCENRHPSHSGEEMGCKVTSEKEP